MAYFTHKILIIIYLLTPFIVGGQPVLVTNGAAAEVAEHCYQLTSAQEGQQVGSVWSDFSVDLNHAFDIEFAVNFGCDSKQGEGMAFLFQVAKDSFEALGCPGPLLGFGKGGNCPGLGPSLAVEMDSRFQRTHGDIFAPHLAIVEDGDLQNPKTVPISAKPYRKSVQNCDYHHVQIIWEPSRELLSVFFDRELRITYKRDLIKEVFGGQSNVYFGFTGSTSSQPNAQLICMRRLRLEIDESHELKRKFADAVAIYPNPLDERLTVDINLRKEAYLKMQLYNSKGEVVYEIPTHAVRNNQYYFNLPGLPSGVYYLTVTNGTQRVNKKIVHISIKRA
jgi:hypothetical protein